MSRKSGVGRKIAIVAMALFAFVGLLVVGLVVVGSFLPTNQPADGTAQSTPAPDAGAPASASSDGQQAEETSTGDEPQAAPSTEPAAAPRVSSPPLPRPAPRQDTVEEQADTQQAQQAESQEPAAEEPASTYSAPEEPPPVSGTNAAPGAPFQELHRLAGEIEIKSAALVDTYGEHLSKKEDSGAELTDKDQKLKDDLDEFQDAAEQFNKGFQVGRFARIWGRKPDDRRRIGQNFRAMAHLESEIESLMIDVRPSAEVRQAWQEVRSRWRQVTAIVTPLLP